MLFRSRQPDSQNLKPGSTATFSIAALGRGKLSYQWNLNGSRIPGATGATLSLTNVQAPDTGAYTVQVTDSVGSSLSKPALLNVLVRPSFVVQPPSLVAIAGDSLEFRVEVTGLAPFAYRWRKGNSVLPGATNAILKLTNVQLSDAGAYSVPPDNPFVGKGGRPEIWLYGVRNPWRWSFDRATGD